MTKLDTTRASTLVAHTWDGDIVPALVDYIRIPNKSPMFDAQWREHGHMDQAVALIESWCRARSLPDLRVEVVQHGDRTPVIFMELSGPTDRV